nr:histidine kinase [Kineosporia babensis]
MRIARELHDVVAHHIAVISVQAGVATHAAVRGPEHLNPALGHIRRSCDVVIEELASVVGLLRGGSAQATVEPVPGLAQLRQLIEECRSTGLDVTLEHQGLPPQLPAISDLAAYRIVQEALTNARKYGDGSADVRLTSLPGKLQLVVCNRVENGQKHQPGSGFGLLGMRERAVSAGGTLTVQDGPGGLFTINAELPVPADLTPTAGRAPATALPRS